MSDAPDRTARADGRCWRYPSELAEPLARLGFAPSETTSPLFVRGAVNDLYRFELRRQRDRLRAGDIERSSYLEIVIALRRKYWMLTLPGPAWEKICGEDEVP